MSSDEVEQNSNKLSIKFLEEKHASSDIKSLLWSPKMDLVAAVTVSIPNEVILYRLHSLKKVWSLPAPNEVSEVVGMAWDPSGRALAIGYSTYRVLVLTIEKACILHTHHLTFVPQHLVWCLVDDRLPQTSQRFTERGATILPSLPPLNQESDYKIQKSCTERDDLTYLIVSGEHGLVHVYVHGFLSIADIDAINFLSKDCEVKSSCLSSDGHYLVSLVATSESSYSLVTMNTDILHDRNREIRVVTNKFILLMNLLEYCEETLRKMEEAWEDGLLELDSKLNMFMTRKLSAEKGSVVIDFMELLMFGILSDELHVFLVKDLTERGIKKLGNSLQVYYKTISDLLSYHLILAIESIFFHLNDLHGLSQWDDVFGAIGLSAELISEALQACGSLRLKANEMHFMVTNGTRNLKAFSHWLYLVILLLTDQRPPAEAVSIPLEDDDVMAFIQDHFQNLDSVNQKIRLEKIGQYLKDSDLHSPMKDDKGLIESALLTTPGLAEGLIYTSDRSKSLTQVYRSMVTKLSAALSQPASFLKTSVKICSEFSLSDGLHVHKMRQYSVKDDEEEGESSLADYIDTVFLLSKDDSTGEKSLVICRIGLRGQMAQQLSTCQLIFTRVGGENSVSQCSQHEVIDFDFYNKSQLMILLKEAGKESHRLVIAKLALTELPPHAWSPGCCWSEFDAGFLIKSSDTKLIDSASHSPHISVSGSRQIGSVALSSRRVQLYMFDVEEDDSDEDDNDDETEYHSGEDNPLTGGSDKENTEY